MSLMDFRSCLLSCLAEALRVVLPDLALICKTCKGEGKVYVPIGNGICRCDPCLKCQSRGLTRLGDTPKEPRE